MQVLATIMKGVIYWFTIAAALTVIGLIWLLMFIVGC
jgi:hypothetical protein